MLSVAPNLQSIVNEDGAVILDGPNNRITTLDAMGGHIWTLLQSGKSRDSILQHLSDLTGEDSLVIDRDLREFLQDLASKHLLVASGGMS